MAKGNTNKMAFYLIPLGIAVNFVLGQIVQLLKLPVYFDAVGTMVVGALFAGVAGFIVGVPVLRLRGDYLAIVTLAFGEIIKNIINILYVGVDGSGLHFSTKNEAALALESGGKAILKGPMGVTANVKLATFTAGFILVLIAITVVLNLVNSRAGRAILALRDNRIAAESVGIGATKYKLMAFVTSAVLAGAAGALYAMNYSSVAAKKFDFNTSILVLVFVVLGGMGLVMLPTNNPPIRAFFPRLGLKKAPAKKGVKQA